MKPVKQVLRRKVRIGGDAHRCWLPPGAAMPLPTPVQEVVLDLLILSDGHDFILEWTDAGTGRVGDTWHGTLEDAETQAAHYFGVERTEWTPASPMAD